MPTKASNVTVNLKIIHATSVTYLFVKANESASLCAQARKTVNKPTKTLRSSDHQGVNSKRDIDLFACSLAFLEYCTGIEVDH